MSYRLQSFLQGCVGVLPDFLLIGGAKVGKTFLFSCLMQNPCVIPGCKEEPHFFSRRYSPNLRLYRAYFPSVFTKNWKRIISRRKILTGEASASYLMSPSAPARVYHDLPSVKLIVLLRDPVERAHSHYLRLLQQGRCSDTFAKLVQRELRHNINDDDVWKQYPQSSRVPYESLLRHGHYADHLEKWYRYFPRERFLIINSQDLFSNPEIVCQDVCRYLEIPYQQPHPYVDNGSVSTPIDRDTRISLQEHFLPYNSRLYELLGKDFGWDHSTVNI